MNTDTTKQQYIDTLDEDPLADLQTLWDEQSRHIDYLLAHHEPRTVHLNPQRRTWRRRIMAQYLLLALLNIVAGSYSLLALLPDPYILIHITGVVLVLTNAFLAAHSLYFYLLVRRHHPARVSLARMSHFIHRMHMRPHYAPLTYQRHSNIINVDFRNAENTALSTFRQVAAVSAVVLIVLTTVSCSPIGDGYAMTNADRASRTVVIENMNSILAQI